MDRMKANFDRLFAALERIEERIVRVNDKVNGIEELSKSWDELLELLKREDAPPGHFFVRGSQAADLRRRMLRESTASKYRIEAERAALEREDNRET